MTIDDVPGPILAGIIVAMTAIVTWAIRTVREANRVTTAAARSTETVEAQNDLIAVLEAKVKTLVDQLAAASKRIKILEDIIHDWTTVRDITEPRDARREKREIRAEVREVAAEARASEATT